MTKKVFDTNLASLQNYINHPCCPFDAEGMAKLIALRDKITELGNEESYKDLSDILTDANYMLAELKAFQNSTKLQNKTEADAAQSKLKAAIIQFQKRVKKEQLSPSPTRQILGFCMLALGVAVSALGGLGVVVGIGLSLAGIGIFAYGRYPNLFVHQKTPYSKLYTQTIDLDQAVQDAAFAGAPYF